MPGLFNNETGQYEDIEWLMNADWYEDKDQNLYIVPLPEVIAECEGPDNETMDKINEACRDHERLTEQDCERLGLTEIADFLKRFDESTGYYHA